MIVDCHVSIWNDEHLTPLYEQQIDRVRPGGAPGLKADADTLYRAMSAADKAIVFPLRYGDSAGIESDDETCAQEYKITDKIFFGTDFPFSSVEESIAGLRNVNAVVEGTRMPHVSQEVIEGVVHSDPFSHWWHQPIRF